MSISLSCCRSISSGNNRRASGASSKNRCKRPRRSGHRPVRSRSPPPRSQRKCPCLRYRSGRASFSSVFAAAGGIALLILFSTKRGVACRANPSRVAANCAARRRPAPRPAQLLIGGSQLNQDEYPAVSFDHRVGTGEQLPKRTLSEFAVVP